MAGQKNEEPMALICLPNHFLPMKSVGRIRHNAFTAYAMETMNSPG